jgi:hypothetical protein
MPAPRASAFWPPKVVAPSSSRTCNLLELRTWSSILFMVKAGGCGCQTCTFLPTPCCFNPSGSDHNTTQYNKLGIDLHTHTPHRHIEIRAQTERQHLILSKALKSPHPRSPLQLHYHHLLSATKNLLQILLLPTSPNLPSKIAYQLCQSSTKDWSLRSSICTKDLLTSFINLPPKNAFQDHQTAPKITYQLHQRLPTTSASCIMKVCLPTSIKDCSQTSIFSTGWTLLPHYHHHHPCSSGKHLFLGFKVWKILLLFSITLPSSSSPPSPSYIPSKFPGKNPSSEKPHPWVLCRLGGWMGGWMMRCRAHTDYD